MKPSSFPVHLDLSYGTFLNLQLESVSWDPCPLNEVPGCSQGEIFNILSVQKRGSKLVMSSGAGASLLHKIWPEDFSFVLQFPHKGLYISLILYNVFLAWYIQFKCLYSPCTAFC